jgi:hypothetical protein
MLDDELHIVAGPSAAACLQEGVALSPAQVLVHHDLLSCGPLPSLDSLEHWRDVREKYLRSLDMEAPNLLFADGDRDVLPIENVFDQRARSRCGWAPVSPSS